MSLRPITALAAAVALLVAAPVASAQEAPEGVSADVELIYDQYENNAGVKGCDHSREALQAALDSITDDFQADYPDFREFVEAGIKRHDDGKCGDATPTPTPTATASPEPTSAAPESGTLPEHGGKSGDGGGAVAPESGALPPDESGALPEATVAPPPVATASAAPPAPLITPT